MRPVEFEAGPPDSSELLVPSPTVRFLDHGLVPLGFGRSMHEQSMHLDVVMADADFGAHDTWLIFEVAEDSTGDLDDAAPSRWLSPALMTPEAAEVASWRFARVNSVSTRCVVLVAENAYGAQAASDTVCADLLPVACDGCSSGGAPGGGAGGLLLLAGACAVRRRRPRN